MRRNVIILSILIICSLLYWNYARFYQRIGEAHLPSPNNQPLYQVGSGLNPPLIYAAMGDSLTAGVGAQNYQHTFPYLIATSLSTRYNVFLYDLGQPGAQIRNLLDYQLPKTISLQPQLVTILIGTNDIHNFTNLDDYRQTYQTIIDQLHAHTQAKIYLLTIPYLGDEHFVYPPWNWLLDSQTNRYNQIIDHLCLDNQVSCIDLYHFTHQPFYNDQSLYAPDHFHPSDSGYILWSKTINEHLHP